MPKSNSRKSNFKFRTVKYYEYEDRDSVKKDYYLKDYPVVFIDNQPHEVKAWLFENGLEDVEIKELCGKSLNEVSQEMLSLLVLKYANQ